ncbi:hypothetical protein [Actinoplanes sp. NPDC026670]|uniref:hypothetical protein n=1 Tax=Actinoplanes sp. NPDC026670 TaxID=3154700 RepID=UPI0033C8734E
MTGPVTPVWRPFHDEPLFVPELLHGPDTVPDRLRTTIVDYLTQVAEIRTAPLHTCTAFNALHFGFDLDRHGYRAEVLEPELFLHISGERPDRPVLPVGAFAHIDRGGRRSLLAEVVARYGADPAVDDDGWTPPALSGAPPGDPDSAGARIGQERIVLDVEAFGAPLTAAEYTELHRLRRRATLLDHRGHLTGPVRYPPGPAARDDIALYTAYLLGPARPLLLGGPLGGLLTDPGDTAVLAAAVHQSMATIDALLDTAPGLLRWHGYTTSQDRFDRRRHDGWPGLAPTAIDEIVRTLSRTGPQPRHTGVWPLLAAHANSRAAGDDDPLDLCAAADVVLHTNLAAAATAAGAPDGLLPGGIHLRVDDTWQAAGIWRAQREPIPAVVLATDPRIPLGLGHQPDTPTEPPLTDEPVPTAEPAAAPDPAPGIPPAADDTTVGPDADRTPELVVVRDSLVVYTAALRESHWDDGTLPLPEPAAAVLADGPILLQLHHDGDILDDTEHLQTVVHTGVALAGITWPWSFYPGIKITVAVARNARRISATTRLLDQPLPFGEQYRWDADLGILAAAIGAETPPPPAGPGGLPDEPLPDGIPERRRGVPALRGLIIAALRRHGATGAFGARRLTGPQLLAALFGPDLTAPPLMWEVIYTCDRLVEAGRLTREENTADPDRPGSGGPDTYVWWPDTSGRRPPGRAGQVAAAAVLAGQIREHWVPPFRRLLPAGHQASDGARQAYAAWIVEVRGSDADTELPAGYTFVRGMLRGAPDPDDPLPQHRPAPQPREGPVPAVRARHPG